MRWIASMLALLVVASTGVVTFTRDAVAAPPQAEGPSRDTIASLRDTIASLRDTVASLRQTIALLRPGAPAPVAQPVASGPYNSVDLKTAMAFAASDYKGKRVEIKVLFGEALLGSATLPDRFPPAEWVQFQVLPEDGNADGACSFVFARNEQAKALLKLKTGDAVTIRGTMDFLSVSNMAVLAVDSIKR